MIKVNFNDYRKGRLVNTSKPSRVQPSGKGGE